MKSSRNRANPRRKAFLSLAGTIESRLRDIYAKKHAQGLTQKALADKLGVGRSVINRRLSGAQNMTTEVIADMVWALDHCIDVIIYDPLEKGDNHGVVTFTGDGSSKESSPLRKAAGDWTCASSQVISAGSAYEPV